MPDWIRLWMETIVPPIPWIARRRAKRLAKKLYELQAMYGENIPDYVLLGFADLCKQAGDYIQCKGVLESLIKSMEAQGERGVLLATAYHELAILF